MTEQIAIPDDTIPVPDGFVEPPEGEIIEVDGGDGEPIQIPVAGPADAAFKATTWALDAVRQQLVLARKQRTNLNDLIRTLVEQEKRLVRMDRIANEPAKAEGDNED